MSFASGFITGLSKSIDDNLKKSMERTQERIDGMAQYRVTRRRTQLERKEKEKDELRDVLTNLASLVDGDIDKAAQIYKGVGGTVSSANEFYTSAMKSKKAMGEDFDMAKAFDFMTENAPSGIAMSQYLDNFTTGVKKMPVSEDEIGGTGLYGALFKPKVGDQIMKQVETTAPLPTEADKFAVPSAKINYNNFMEAKDYEKKNRFKSDSTNEATLLDVEDEIYYTPPSQTEKIKFLKSKKKRLEALIKKEFQNKIAVKRAGSTTTTSMFSKINRDKKIANAQIDGVGDTKLLSKDVNNELVDALEGNEAKIYYGKLKGLKALKDSGNYTSDAIFTNQINYTMGLIDDKVKAYKDDFKFGRNLRSKTYHAGKDGRGLTAADAIAKTKATGTTAPVIKVGDVVTVKSPTENNPDATKTVIWTGSDFY